MSGAWIIALFVGGFFLLVMSSGLKGKTYPGQWNMWSLKDAVGVLGFGVLFGTAIALFVIDAI